MLVTYSLSAEAYLLQGPGDLWYFPPGVPHSLQATNQSEGGSEFLLVSICIMIDLVVRPNLRADLRQR